MMRETFVLGWDISKWASDNKGAAMKKVAMYSTVESRSDRLHRYIEYMKNLNGQVVDIRVYDNLDLLKWDLDSSLEYDVVVIDHDWSACVEMRKRYKSINLVMVTDGLSGELYDAQPCYILGEPLEQENIIKLFACIWGNPSGDHILSFRSGRVKHRINMREILYFANDRRLIHVVGLNEQYSFYGSMRDLENRVGGEHMSFVRVHESYIVNMDYVRELYPDRLVMQNGDSIYMSVARRPEVRRHYKMYQDKFTYI